MTFANWTWGDGAHSEHDCGSLDPPARPQFKRCYDCEEWCLRPETATDHQLMCRCCRYALYQLRIAELEQELAKFKLCDVGQGADSDEAFGCELHYRRGKNHGATIHHGADIYHRLTQ